MDLPDLGGGGVFRDIINFNINAFFSFFLPQLIQVYEEPTFIYVYECILGQIWLKETNTSESVLEI